ncbi:AAA family ATPase [Chromatiales bacterium (ex Bugula neritina AB1)]|nr:AAA family ATPase [Chromatiales bacterium (ex Bugula neritina AB1)]
MTSDNNLADWRHKALSTEAAINAVVIGQQDLIRLINIALFARGHVLLEGDVGVGKTTVLRAFARAAGGDFERTEGTIDLMPNDLVYHTYVDADGQPRIDPGPLLRHGESLTTFFFNEINRARPQVQSLLLRAMAERSVSAFNREYNFPHMTVFADRNKVEKEETFELASAARDRFMFELNMGTPVDEEIRRSLIIDTAYHNADALIEEVPPGLCPGDQLNGISRTIQQTVRTSPAIEKYLLEVWRASESPAAFGVSVDGVDMDRLILAGASPRGMSAMVRAARVVAWINDRDHILPEDVHTVLPSALGHRVFFNPVYELRRSEIAPVLVKSIMNVVASP